MSDLIKRDDALRSLEEWYARTCKPETLQGLADILAGYSAYKDIAKLPAVDAVEVVRCSQCKYLVELNEHKIFAMCKKTKIVFWSFETDTRAHFCAFGERREENAVD